MIKEKFINSSEALYNLGFAYYIKKRYNEAKECFIKSNELKKSTATEFLIIVTEIQPITQRRAAIFTISETEKTILRNAYNRLMSSEMCDYFDKAVKEFKAEYWHARVGTLLFLNKEEALKLIDDLPADIKKSPDIKILIADTFILNNEREKALEILQEVYNEYKQPEILLKILNIHISKNEKKKVLEIYNELKEADFDKDGHIAATIIEVIAEEEDIEEANKEAERFITEGANPFFLFHSLGLINFNKGYKNKALELFKALLAGIPADNFPPRAIFAEDMYKCGFSDLALGCLKPFIQYNDKAELRYIQMLILTEEEKNLLEAETLINNKLQKPENSLQWLKLKIDLLHKSGKKNAALQELDKLIESDPSVSNAYNAVALKMELGEKGYSRYTKILEHDEENPISLITAGLCYKAEGNYAQAEVLSYRALAKNKDVLNDTTIDLLYRNYLGINLFPEIPGKENERADLDEIEINSAFEIDNNTKKIWLAIESDNTIFNGEETLIFIGAIHFKQNNSKVIRLIGKKLNETIQFEEESYKVNQITTLKTRAIRYCIDLYTSNRPDSNFMKGIKIDTEHPITSMLPMLFEMEKHQKDLLEQYNLKNNIGIPLWLISKQFGQNLLDGIFYILNKVNQVFYAGEVILFNPEGTTLVLSPSSILMLNILDVFEVAKNKLSNICISKETYNYFLAELERINVQDRRVKMTMGIDNGKPILSEISDEHFKTRREFFAKIVDNLSKISIQDDIIEKAELDQYYKIIELITLQDFSGIHLANSLSGIYICDDLFIRKTSNILLQKSITTNIVGLLYLLFKDDTDLLFDHLDKLAKSNYLYIYNDHLLLTLIRHIIEQHIILGPDTLYGRLQKLIHYSLSTKQQLDYYEPILLNVIQILYNNGIDEYSDYIIKSIIKEIWLYYSLNSLSSELLIKKLASISSNEKDFQYLVSVLNEVKSGDYN
jgi:tetratricopeptide (TPR) repeat protein